MFGDRKPKFRSRKLEFNKTLAVYRPQDLAGALDDVSLTSYEDVVASHHQEEGHGALRSVVQVATGVEKEEEDEHHLRQALHTQMTATSKQDYNIPTPEAAQMVPDYDELYPPVSLDSTMAVVVKQEEVVSSFATRSEDRIPRYFANEADRVFVQELCADGDGCNLSVDLFEEIMETFEETSTMHNNEVELVTVDCLDRILDVMDRPPSQSTIMSILEFWKMQRQRIAMEEKYLKSLLPMLRVEDGSDAKMGSDPYVCFRRRQLKNNRKTRRSDTQVVDRLFRLCRDISSSALLLSAMALRDEHKLDALEVERSIFEKYKVLEAARMRNKSLQISSSLPSFKVAAQSLMELKRKPLPESAALSISTSSVGGASAEQLKMAASYDPAVQLVNSCRQFHQQQEQTVGCSLQYAMPDAANAIAQERRRMLAVWSGSLNTSLEGMESHASVPHLAMNAFGRDESHASLSDLESIASSLFDQQRIKRSKVFPFLEIPFSGKDTLLKANSFPSWQQSSNIKESATASLLWSGEHAKLLSTKDFTQLQTAVGNYNVHAVHTANLIQRPMSHQAWIAATVPIVHGISSASNAQSKGNGGGAQGASQTNNGGEGGRNSTASSPRKKKKDSKSKSASPTKRSRDDAASSNISNVGDLGSSGIITVKVKSKGHRESSLISSDADSVASTHGARFTINGLEPSD